MQFDIVRMAAPRVYFALRGNTDANRGIHY